MKFMNKNKKGFTLVELMIVVVIMAILVAVAVPIFNSVTKNAKIRTCNANARTLGSQVNTIVMNVIGGGTGDDSQAVVSQELTAELTINTLLGVTGQTGKFGDYLQGGKMPLCPVNNNNKYHVGADGRVKCSGTDTEGEHTTSPASP